MLASHLGRYAVPWTGSYALISRTPSTNETTVRVMTRKPDQRGRPLTRERIIASRTYFFVYDLWVPWQPQATWVDVLRIMHTPFWLPGDED
jgi:hypothetical protein